MSNRGTKGDYRVGRLLPDSSGGIGFANGNLTHKVKELAFVNSSTCETDTLFDLPALGIVTHVFVKLTTPSTAGGVLNVGLLSSESGGNVRGFINGISSSSSGTHDAAAGPFAATSSGTIGPFMSGASTASNLPAEFVIDSVAARSVSYNTNASATAVAGKIYIGYYEIA